MSNRPCRIEGCPRSADAAKGLCWPHYQKLRRYGSATETPGIKRSLTDEQVVELRRLRGEGVSTVDLAQRFNITQGQASAAARGDTYRHVPLNPLVPRRSRKGPPSGPPKAAITPEQVRYIRRAAAEGESLRTLAVLIDCSPSTIKLIADRKLYAHVED